MASIAELTNLKAMSVYYERKMLTQPPYAGETYFKPSKIPTDLLAYLTSKEDAPKLARGSAYDAQPTPRNREKFAEQFFSTSFFRETSVLNEKDLEDINRASFTNDDTLVATLIMGLFDDKTKSLLAMRARREFMAMQALTDGKLDFITNGVPTNIVYKSDPDLEKTVATDWSDAKNANPFEDLRLAIRTMKHKGITPNQVLMNDDTFRLIQHNEKVKATYWPQNANLQQMVMREQDVVDAIISELHVVPVIYDQGFIDAEATGTNEFTPYIKGDRIILMNAPIPQEFALTGSTSRATVQSNGLEIGHMAFAPTPEELGVRSNKIESNTVQFFDTAVAYHEYYDKQLVQTQDLVSMNALPSFEGSQSVFRLTITKPAGTTDPNQGTGTDDSGK